VYSIKMTNYPTILQQLKESLINFINFCDLKLIFWGVRSTKNAI
jgi:hypothetical protein